MLFFDWKVTELGVGSFSIISILIQRSKFESQMIMLLKNALQSRLNSRIILKILSLPIENITCYVSVYLDNLSKSFKDDQSIKCLDDLILWIDG